MTLDVSHRFSITHKHRHQSHVSTIHEDENMRRHDRRINLYMMAFLVRETRSRTRPSSSSSTTTTTTTTTTTPSMNQLHPQSSPLCPSRAFASSAAAAVESLYLSNASCLAFGAESLPCWTSAPGEVVLDVVVAPATEHLETNPIPLRTTMVRRRRRRLARERSRSSWHIYIYIYSRIGCWRRSTYVVRDQSQVYHHHHHNVCVCVWSCIGDCDSYIISCGRDLARSKQGRYRCAWPCSLDI